MQKTPTTPDFSDTGKTKKPCMKMSYFLMTKRLKNKTYQSSYPPEQLFRTDVAVCRDGYHLDLKYGRYTAACAWFETFFGESPIGITYRPEGVTDEQASIAQHAAHFAILRPTSVTDMSNF